MQSGKLWHPLNLEEQSQVQDPDSGQLVVKWVHVAKVWAEVIPSSVNQFFAAKAAQSEVIAMIKIRARKDINASQRLVNIRTGDIYNIEGVMRDPKSGYHWMTLPVSQGVNDGQ